jgi:hypothetical protein
LVNLKNKSGIIYYMATGKSNIYEIPFPQSGDVVNVHGDIKSLAERLDLVLPQASYVDIPVKNTSGSSINPGSAVYVTGHDGTNVTVSPSTGSTTSPTLGLMRAAVANNAVGVVVVAGVITGINTSSFAAGDILFIGETGGLVNASSSSTGVGVATVIHAAVSGTIMVGTRGDGTWGALKAGLA